MSLNAGNARQGIPPDQGLDELFKKLHYEKQTNRFYQEMQVKRQTLPIFPQAQAICNSIENNRNNQATVISGETGSGKTTQVPQFILDEYITKGQGSRCRIICTQPRRISAISVADRVALERAERVGGTDSTVGFQIGMEQQRPREKGSILFCTPGIVLRWLESDPLLSTVSHVILDEIHERDIHSEFLLTILKQLLPKRPDLKLVLMSATLNTEKFSRYYGNCPIFRIPGFLYPVTEHFLEDVVEMTSYRPARTFRGQGGHHKLMFQQWLNSQRHSYEVKNTLTALFNDNSIDLDLIVSLINILVVKEEGAILVFLPGWDEITRLYDKLLSNYTYQSERFRILVLHGGMMSTEEQQKVFLPAPRGVRKIVISTNVAETSITIDDVVYVIDSGKGKLQHFNPQKNFVTLENEWNSLANSQQRKGRAGRVKPGHCYHLYTRFQHSHLKDFHKPEMLRTRLENLGLQIKLLNRGNIKAFFDQAMETPHLGAIDRSIKHLKKLGALDVYENLTPLGTQLARMPTDPHIGKMILFGAVFCCLDPILTIAATLDYRTKTPFSTPPKKNDRLRADVKKREIASNSCSDHLMFHNAYKGWLRAKASGDGAGYVYRNFLAEDTLQEIKKRRDQFAEVLHDVGFISSSSPTDQAANINSRDEKLLRAIVCAGLYPNVGKINTTRRVPGLGTHYYKIDIGSDEDVEMHIKSVNHEQSMPYDYVVYFQKMKTKNLSLFDSTGVSLTPLVFFGSKFKMEYPNTLGNVTTVVIDRLVSLKTSPAEANELEALRRELWDILTKRFEDPCPTVLSDDDNESWIMKTILRKISEDATVSMN